MACRGGSVDNPGETKWKINQLIKLSCKYKHAIGMLKFYFRLDNCIWRKKKIVLNVKMRKLQEIDKPSNTYHFAFESKMRKTRFQ